MAEKEAKLDDIVRFDPQYGSFVCFSILFLHESKM